MGGGLEEELQCPESEEEHFESEAMHLTHLTVLQARFSTSAQLTLGCG